ncbi:Las1-like-domain-containing protein [Microdochium bolleyi]|uniref:Las1-like-domain-containing protein n=1 Tax=Microdochium bolleyi TaxID=196109 RepID=A0A136J7W2_9PEZI|nr:Las1-like-domain-containing protein [Microdochium bolleyi]
MVQYIVTPWRDHAELIDVRGYLYPDGGLRDTSSDAIPDTTSDEAKAIEQQQLCQQQRRLAVGRVQMWAHRGNCPHLVESTALLVAVALDDDDLMRRQQQQNRTGLQGQAASDFAIRAAYATAFSRFVTGLLDSQQDKQKKQSMYSLAKTIGLPATFVELRHQATHEQLPSLLKLRSAARKALAWIWEFYWRDLPLPAVEGKRSSHDSSVFGRASRPSDGSSAPASASAVSCEAALLAFLRGEIDEGVARGHLAPYDQWQIVQVTNEIGETTDDTKVMVRALHLVGDMLEGTCSLITKKPAAAVEGPGGVSEAGAMDEPSDNSRQNRAWSRLSKESWTPKPIGTV